ncbi:hypothetical protein [Desulfosporosinus sp.]|uniref:hypothetical protein n=1 Tax=Desulfosporosinus sp. TaxID=157907 RepID=UPI00260DDBF1|nr:hypothetical protein [Desulfosporosinus sp.]
MIATLPDGFAPQVHSSLSGVDGGRNRREFGRRGLRPTGDGNAWGEVELLRSQLN